MNFVFNGKGDFKKLDYISCWFYKAALYIKNTDHKYSFVTTNSICQGIQVGLLWPLLFESKIEIGFAHLSFKWENNAKNNAGVYVIIIGIRTISKSDKYLFSANQKISVKNINPYLSNSSNIIVYNRNNHISELPKMVSGLKAGDDGNLTFDEEEKNKLIEKDPLIKKYIKKYVGAKDFMHGWNRYCIWVNDIDYKEAKNIPTLQARFEKLKDFRLNSKKKATRKKAEKPYAFDETNYVESDLMLIPQTGSERREYLPIGFLSSEYVVSNGARVIYSPEPWLFGVLSSKMHIQWVKAVAGRLKMDMQYSNTICYNTFPFPSISKSQKEEITKYVLRILDERQKHSQLTMAEMYDPDKMPKELLEAHIMNDKAIERCYRIKHFEDDRERLEHLFKQYEKMIQEEQTANTLFAKQKKTRKKK